MPRSQCDVLHVLNFVNNLNMIYPIQCISNGSSGSNPLIQISLLRQAIN